MTRACVLAVLICVATTSIASAHAHLVSATPADGAVVHAGPIQLTLTFSEGLEAKLSGVSLTAADKKDIPVGATTLADGDDRTMVVPLPAPLGAGAYTVSWHALSKDGHTTHSTYVFTVAP